MKIGRITISDRASAGIYEDRSGPEIKNVLREFFGGEIKFEPAIVPDEVEMISAALKKFADELQCDLI
ncbi:MAG TPA: molybdopterin adenylyltransferase, partial [Verrucomicrobiae bacterium]